MLSGSFTRRTFASRLASILSVLGITVVGISDVSAQAPGGVRKLDEKGQPADGKPMITPLIVHNGLIYISGQGANDIGSVGSLDIETHTRKVLDNVKKLVEAGGGSMENILELTVYLATLADYEAMNKVYYGTYFPHGGPKRTTVAVAGVPGHSLLEINCIAAVARP